MKFRVTDLQSSEIHKVRFVSSSRPPAERWAGLTDIWTASTNAAWATGACVSTRTTWLHFVRWWSSTHHTGVLERDLSESTLLEYVRFQSGFQPPPSGSTINARVAVADRALRNEFPDAPCQIARGFHPAYLRRQPLGLGRPRWAFSRLRVNVPKRNIVPLSVEEVARFWSSFRTARDLAIVGLMLLQGLRSAEVLALNPDDVLLSEGQVRVRGRRRTAGGPVNLAAGAGP